MATSFVRKNGVAGATRTLLYTCPTGKTAIVFDGQLTNVDSTYKQPHLITIEIQQVNTTYTTIFKDIELPYGRSSPLPKQILVAGEKLYVTADAASAVECGFQIVEK